ncbi:RNase A-like domain-containing protein [Pseudomonas sp. NPDC090203]|uniref:RNase A-like domain-containing protein n=1 Tax=Pseudomonas sp. NPDC090203 TaxID=3364477 RepID=UPI003809AAAE
MSDQEEFHVVLSYAQMAAILEHESLSETEIRSNRIFGSLRLVGGIIELAGAGVLCAAPEPTLVTKVGCVAMGVHGADQSSAGMHQLVTGKSTDSFAFKIGASTAGMLGASKTGARVIGLATEFAVPLSTASLYGAFRVSSVRAGKMTLVVSERFPNAPVKGPGGHAMQHHVGKDIDALQKRLKRKRAADVMSTFTSLEKAEWAVSRTLQRHRYKILAYSKAKLLRTSNRLTVKMSFVEDVGWGITRLAPDVPVGMKNVVVVIKFTEYNHMPAFIVTAYPVP